MILSKHSDSSRRHYGEVFLSISHGIFLVTLADTVMIAFTKKGFPKGNCDGLEIVFIGKFSNNPSKCDQLAGGESSESQPMMVET